METILPEVKLPDYRKIASQVKKREVSVTPEEILKLKKEKEIIEKERIRAEILAKIAEESEVILPQVLIESEQKRMLETLKIQVPQMLQISFEDYLKKINQTEQELSDHFLLEAQKRVKNTLVLIAIQKKENINVSEEEIAKDSEKISEINPNLDKNQLRDYTESVLKNEKTLEYLEDFIK